MDGLRAACRRAVAALSVGVAALTAGCAGEEGEKLAPVSGEVTVNGQPVPSGNVTFCPDGSKGNASQHQPIGSIGAGGRFELFVPGGKKGAPAGWYKVVVLALDDPQPGKPNKYLVNKKYASQASTPLSVEVVANPDAGRYDWKLTK